MKRRFSISVLLFVAALNTGTPSSLAENAGERGFIPGRLDRIGDAINVEIDSGKIPGAVALVVKDGEIAYFEAFGFADIDTRQAMRKDTIFRIASMTKAITSVAVMILYEQGHFLLNDPVSRYMPEFADMNVVAEIDDDGNVSTTVVSSKPIKIIDLLTHSSGISYPFIPSSVQNEYLEAGVITGLTTERISLSEQMELLSEQPLLFEPGSDFAYGLSTDLLGYLVETVSKKSLSKFLRDEVFAPLNMSDTHFYLPEGKAQRLATLYAYVDDRGLVVSEGSEAEPLFDDPLYPSSGAGTYFSGGAGLSSTASDYARFLQMLLADGAFDGTRLLSRKSVELMRTARVDINDDQVPDMGLGFAITRDLGKKGELGSVGSYAWGGAFNTYFWIDPEENLISVFMCQVRPVESNVVQKFSNLVYQALE